MKSKTHALVDLMLAFAAGGAAVYMSIFLEPDMSKDIATENFINRIENLSGQKISSDLKEELIIKKIPNSDLNAVIFDGYRYVTNHDSSVLLAAGPNGISAITKNNGKDVEFFESEVVGTIAERINKELTDTIDFVANNEKGQVTAFIDPYCHYCSMLVKDIEKYNQEGITVRIAALPMFNDDMRPSFDTASRIWSDKNPKAALLNYKDSLDKYRASDMSEPFKVDLPEATEQGMNAIKKQQTSASKLGNVGVPIILTKDQVISGYVEPKELAKILGFDSATKDQVQEAK